MCVSIHMKHVYTCTACDRKKIIYKDFDQISGKSLVFHNFRTAFTTHYFPYYVSYNILSQ